MLMRWFTVISILYDHIAIKLVVFQVIFARGVKFIA